ncbi:MAG: HdeD family acid-resistance protein [Rhizomicrobium sp.]
MTDILPAGSVLHTRLRASSRELFWLGLGMTIVGIIAIGFPIVSTLATALFVGWMFLLAGVFLFVGSFTIHGTGPFFGAMLMALLMIAAGVFLLFHPLAGAMALTIVLGVLFLFQGAFELALAFEMRPHPGWVWMLLSGAASVILALVIAVGLPGISLIALGVLLGINFLSTGLGYIFASRA